MPLQLIRKLVPFRPGSLLCLGLVLALAAPARADPHPFFQSLIAHLAGQGLDQAWLEEIFRRPCVDFQPEVLLLRLRLREAELNYARFWEDKALAQARAFQDRHQAVLGQAAGQWGVPPEIIVAVLLIESNLGESTGRFQTLSTLASHAAADQPEVAAEVFRRLRPEEKERFSPAKLHRYFRDRAAWFQNELAAFVRYLEEAGADPCQVHGSYTGAIGLCQFQPSNLKAHGRDGSGDGKVNLFEVRDAVFSIAAYLANHGWRRGANPEGQTRVLRRYNNSQPYVRAVLQVARRLRP